MFKENKNTILKRQKYLNKSIKINAQIQNKKRIKIISNNYAIR